MLISKFGGNNIIEEIEMFEDVIGNTLPKQLREFLEKYNGGQTPNTKFLCENISSDVRAFYGVGKVQYSYNAVNTVMYKNDIYLPFAFDSFGNELLIAIETGKIFFKDHENVMIKRLTSDLRGFINCCESTVINPSAVKSIKERETELIKGGRGNIITDALREMWKAEIDKYTSMKQEKVII